MPYSKTYTTTRKAYVHSYIILLLLKLFAIQYMDVGPNILDPMAGIKSQDIVLVSSALVKPQMNKGVGHFFMKLRQTTLKLGFLRYPSFEFLCTLASWHGMAYWDYDLLQLLYTSKKKVSHINTIISHH